MAEGKEKAHRKRMFTFLHELASHIVDRRNVISIHGVPKTECVSQKSGPKENWFIMEREKRPDPSPKVKATQKAINSNHPVSELWRSYTDHVSWKPFMVSSLFQTVARGSFILFYRMFVTASAVKPIPIIRITNALTTGNTRIHAPACGIRCNSRLPFTNSKPIAVSTAAKPTLKAKTRTMPKPTRFSETAASSNTSADGNGRDHDRDGDHRRDRDHDEGGDEALTRDHDRALPQRARVPASAAPARGSTTSRHPCQPRSNLTLLPTMDTTVPAPRTAMRITRSIPARKSPAYASR